jgi:hypothetical protein
MALPSGCRPAGRAAAEAELETDARHSPGGLSPFSGLRFRSNVGFRIHGFLSVSLLRGKTSHSGQYHQPRRIQKYKNAVQSETH